MLTLSENEHVFHMPIDVQEYFYEDLLDERRKAFPRKIRAFSRDLESLGIRTLPVAYEMNSVNNGFMSVPFQKSGKKFFDALTFTPDFYPGYSNAIYVKGSDNAFHNDTLASQIAKMGAKVILVTGMNTRACVEDTIIGAFKKCKEDVCVHVVYDLLADNGVCVRESEADPLFHKTALERDLNRDILSSPRFCFVTSADVLERHSFSKECQFLLGHTQAFGRVAEGALKQLSCQTEPVPVPEPMPVFEPMPAFEQIQSLRQTKEPQSVKQWFYAKLTAALRA